MEITLRRTRFGPPDRSEARKSLVEQAYGLDLLLQGFIESFSKFDPRVQIRNPVMFVVWLGALVTAALTVDPELFGPSTAVTLILLVTVWFANAAEALAEGRGKQNAAALRRTKTELTAKPIQPNGECELVPAAAVHNGDLVRVDRSELIPTMAR